jgi:hypothetical protein
MKTQRFPSHHPRLLIPRHQQPTAPHPPHIHSIPLHTPHRIQLHIIKVIHSDFIGREEALAGLISGFGLLSAVSFDLVGGDRLAVQFDVLLVELFGRLEQVFQHHAQHDRLR